MEVLLSLFPVCGTRVYDLFLFPLPEPEFRAVIAPAQIS